MKLVKKISIGTVNGVRGGLKDIKGKVRVMTIFGIASACVVKTSETMGVSYKFTGEFKAVNRDGEEYVSSVAYLAEPAQSLIAAALDYGKSDKPPVEFALSIWAVEDESAIKGYYFETEPHMEHRASESLARLQLELPKIDGVQLTLPQIGHDGAKPLDDAKAQADAANADSKVPARKR